MQQVLEECVTWAQQPNGAMKVRNSFAVTTLDVKELPTMDADVSDTVRYDFRGKPSPATHAAIASFMRQPTTNLPYVRRVSHYASVPGVLAALQEWHGANDEVVPTAVSGAQPRRAQATSEDIGRALTLRALRAPTDASRLASSRSTSASTVPRFVLCNGQVTRDGVPRATWAASTKCRCGLLLRGVLPINNTFPRRIYKRCGGDGVLANEQRRLGRGVWASAPGNES